MKFSDNKKGFKRKTSYKRGVFLFVLIFIVSNVSIFIIANSPLYEFKTVYAITPENKTEEILPYSNIKIKFSHPIIHSIAERNFEIQPYIDGRVEWKNFGRTFVFVPNKMLMPDTNYTISFKYLRSIFGASVKDIKYNFSTFKTPQIVKITPENGAEKVKTNDNFEIELSRPNRFTKFILKTKPQINYEVEQSEDGFKYILKPTERLQQETEYNFEIEKVFVVDISNFVKIINNIFKLTEAKTKTTIESDPKKIYEGTFKTVSPIKLESTYPSNGERNVSIYDSIKFIFDKNVNYESAKEHFSIFPKQDGNFESWNNVFVFYPSSLNFETKYEVKMMSGMKAEDGSILEDDVIIKFSTQTPPSAYSDEPAGPPLIKKGKYIDISIGKQILTIYRDGVSEGNFKISSGTWSMPTPLGTHQIYNKSLRAYSEEYNLYMPYWMAFTPSGSHGIHELPEWPGGYKEGEYHLGYRVSHGCVRLGVGPAEFVYNWTPIGTPVIIHE